MDEFFFYLGGQSHETAQKGCPKHAAFSLWQLGSIKGTKVLLKSLPIKAIDAEYGKNTAYAVIAIELIEQNKAAANAEDLWQQVRYVYRQKVGQEPAIHQQGAVSVARILYDEGQIEASKS